MTDQSKRPPDNLAGHLRHLGGQRDIYVWGAQWKGISIAKKLTGAGVSIKAFVDRDRSLIGTRINGLTVLDSNLFWASPPPRAFLILASEQYFASMAETCRKHGLAYGDDFLYGADIQPNHYLIDVVGSCNLRCISCPRGNYEWQRPAGLMSVEDYARVVEKIVKEDPLAGALGLHSWGEPLMHPQMAEIIKVTNSFGLNSSISTNLNIGRDLEEVVKAGLTWLKVSTSGFGPSYEKTHAGGKWEILLSNLHRLRELREKHHPEMHVEIGYHLYKHNCGEDRDKMKALAAGLGFAYREVLAHISPLENRIAACLGQPLSETAEEAERLLLLPLQEAQALVEAEKHLPCINDNQIVIDWDLHVETCCVTFDSGNWLVDETFLETTLSDLQKAKRDSPLCRRCREMAQHRLLGAYSNPQICAERLESFQATCSRRGK